MFHEFASIGDPKKIRLLFFTESIAEIITKKEMIYLKPR